MSTVFPVAPSLASDGSGQTRRCETEICDTGSPDFIGFAARCRSHHFSNTGKLTESSLSEVARQSEAGIGSVRSKGRSGHIV